MTAPEGSRTAGDEEDRTTLRKRLQNAFWIVASLLVCGTILALCGWLYLVLGPGWFVLALIPLVIGLIAAPIFAVLIVIRIRIRRAVRAFHRAFGPLGKDLLLVTSDSPHWKDHIERHWISRWGSRAVVLNWSERSRWDWTRPEVVLFRRLTGDREYNPLAIVIGPEAREFAVIEFWKAFRELKHGKPVRLAEAEGRLADYLEALDHGRSLDSVPERVDPDERRLTLRREFKKRSGAW